MMESRIHVLSRTLDSKRAAVTASRRLLPIVAASLVFAIRSNPAAAVYDPFMIENARAAGMGRVTAIAGDGTIATWWNPAFLAFVTNRSLALSDADLAGC